MKLYIGPFTSGFLGPIFFAGNQKRLSLLKAARMERRDKEKSIATKVWSAKQWVLAPWWQQSLIFQFPIDNI